MMRIKRNEKHNDATIRTATAILLCFMFILAGSRSIYYEVMAFLAIFPPKKYNNKKMKKKITTTHAKTKRTTSFIKTLEIFDDKQMLTDDINICIILEVHSLLC